MSTLPSGVNRAAVIGCLLIGLGMAGCPWWPNGRPTVLPLDNRNLAEQIETLSDPAKPAAAIPDFGPVDPEPSTRLSTPTDGPKPADDPQNRAYTSNDPSGVLGRDDFWIQAVRSPEESDAEPIYRWRYPNLEDLLSRRGERRPDLKIPLLDGNTIVATNAAIGLSRWGDSSGMEQLADGARNPDLKLEMRRAAVEALASLRRPSPVPLLRELVDQYGNRAQNGQSRYIPDLHAELIRGLARHVDAADDSRFVEALASRASNVKLESLHAWLAGRRGELPEEAVHLRADSDPRVRAAALEALARRGGPDDFEFLSVALEDPELKVRIAATKALGELGGIEAQTKLEKMLEDRPDLIRSAAVSALATSGAEQKVWDAAEDESWQVRLAVAAALARYPNRNGGAIAQRLLDDRSSAVQREVVAAIVGWPLRQAAPVLFAALDKPGYKIRQEAAEQLADRLMDRLPEVAAFPFDARAERRAEALEELKRRFRQEIGFADPETLASAVDRTRVPATRSVPPEEIADVQGRLRSLSAPGLSEPVRRQLAAQLAGHGPGLVEVLEHLAVDRNQLLPETVYGEVLPRCDPVFAVLDRLASQDVLVRRRAASELVELAHKQSLRPLAMTRLASLGVTETDTLVWEDLLTAVASDGSEPSIRLAYAAIGHWSPEIRRRACEYLAAHPDAKHVEVLLPVLDDHNASIARAATRAIGLAGRLDDTEPLKRLLGATNQPLQAEAALALARLGDPSGPAALERLSYSNDAAVCRQVAHAMGQIADATFIASLIRLLDHRQSVRRVALESLPKVVGYDVAEAEGGSSPTFAERLDAWKRWHRRHQSSTGSRTPPGNVR